MRKSFVALLTIVALAAAPMVGADASAPSGTNTGTAPVTSNGWTPAAPGVNDVKQIVDPDADYTEATCKIHLTRFEDFDSRRFVAGCFAPPNKERVDFEPTVEKRKVPRSWATWGSPPDTEGKHPNILYTNGSTTLTVSFSAPMTIVGVEAEPNPFEVHTFQMEFFSGATSLGVITRDINGDHGARLLAGQSDGITSVVITSDVDFSIGRIRLAQ
jgi:hypothetical protein